jgi:hypothetical protein
MILLSKESPRTESHRGGIIKNENQMSDENGKVPLTEKQAAERLNVSVSTLRYWRGCSDGPEYYKLGNAKRSQVRYDADVLEAWLRAHLRVPKARATAEEKYVAL